jgi:hypothetical protein
MDLQRHILNRRWRHNDKMLKQYPNHHHVHIRYKNGMCFICAYGNIRSSPRGSAAPSFSYTRHGVIIIDAIQYPYPHHIHIRYTLLAHRMVAISAAVRWIAAPYFIPGNGVISTEADTISRSPSYPYPLQNGHCPICAGSYIRSPGWIGAPHFQYQAMASSSTSR